MNVWRSDCTLTGGVFQFQVEIFEPGSQILGKGCFEARASRPAAFGRALEVAALTGCHVSKCTARRPIDQHAISGITQSGTQGRKPKILRLAGRPSTAEWAGDLAIDLGAVEIRLCAVDKAVSLEIHADRGAGEEALEIEISGRPTRIEGVAPIAGAKAVAKIEAKIDAAPIVDGASGWDVSRWSARGRGRDRRRQIGRKPLAPSSQCQGSRQQLALYATPKKRCRKEFDQCRNK